MLQNDDEDDDDDDDDVYDDNDGQKIVIENGKIKKNCNKNWKNLSILPMRITNECHLLIFTINNCVVVLYFML